MSRPMAQAKSRERRVTPAWTGCPTVQALTTSLLVNLMPMGRLSSRPYFARKGNL